jgi:hypothetical protein
MHLQCSPALVELTKLEVPSAKFLRRSARNDKG